MKQQKTKIEGKFLYDKYVEYVLIIHDISSEQFNSMEKEKRRDFQITLEDVITPLLIEYFPQNAFEKDTWLNVYRLQSEIEDHVMVEPELPEDLWMMKKKIDLRLNMIINNFSAMLKSGRFFGLTSNKYNLLCRCVLQKL